MCVITSIGEMSPAMTQRLRTSSASEKNGAGQRKEKRAVVAERARRRNRATAGRRSGRRGARFRENPRGVGSRGRTL